MSSIKSKNIILSWIGIVLVSIVLLYKLLIFVKGVPIGYIAISIVDVCFLVYFIIILEKSYKNITCSTLNIVIIMVIYAISVFTIKYSSSPNVSVIVLCISALIVYILILGNIAKHIGKLKGYSNGFIWGALLGIIGIIVVYLMPYNKNANSNQATKIKDLSLLMKEGIITQEEFELKKKELLNKI